MSALVTDIAEVCADRSRAVILADLDVEYTGREVLSHMSGWQSELAKTGASEGDVVAVALDSRPQQVIAVLAAWGLGMRVVVINPFLGSHDMAVALDRTRPAVLVRASVGDAPVPGPRFLVLDEANPPHASSDPTVDGDPGGNFAIGFTSGTTGPPKAVAHDEDRVLRNFGMYSSRTGVSGDDVSICVLPSYLLAALLPGAVFSLWSGALTVMPGRFSVDGYVRAASRRQISYCMGVPTVYRDLLAADLPADVDPGKVRWNLCGGAPLDRKTADGFESRFGAPLSPCSGSTEVGGYLSIEDHPGSSPPGAVGRPLEHFGLEIVDDAGGGVEAGVPGHMSIEASAAMANFWESGVPVPWPHDMERLVTGDFGFVDQAGNLSFIDRSSSVINRGGLKVFPVEVEQEIREVDGVFDCIVVGSSDDRLGEVPVAHVELETGVEADTFVGLIMERLRESLASYKVPTRIKVHEPEALERSPLGKIKRNQFE